MSYSRLLGPYRTLGSIPHAPALMATCLLGRLHMPAVPMALTFLVAEWTGSYAISGLLVGCVTVGQAVAGPLRGRAADRGSAPLLLLVTGLLYAVGLVLITVLTRSFAPWLWWLALPLALLTGLSMPPVSQLGRAVWPRLTGGAGLDAAYAVEATLQELLFVVAPVLAAFAVTSVGAASTTLAVAGWSLLGPALFALALHRAGPHRADAAQPAAAVRGRSLLWTPGMARMLLFGGALVGGLVATDLLLVAWARQRGTPELAGLLAAIWAFGSLLGGLLMGGASGRPVLWRRGLAAAVGLLLLVPVLPPVSIPGTPWLVGVLLLAGGLAIAPSLAAGNGVLAGLAPHTRRNEAFGWYFSATTGGAALASPLSGWLLDLAGPAAAAAGAAVLAGFAVVVVTHHSVRVSHSHPRTEETAPS